VVYLAAAPVYPWLRHISESEQLPHTPSEQLRAAHASVLEGNASGNTIIIPKINVRAAIVEAPDERGLERGAWRMPDTARPGEVGNAVITAHRFKYLPPNNKTFYNLNKLTPGDVIAVVWEGERLLYEVSEVKVVDESEVSILEQDTGEQLTLFTCHPLFSTKERFVVIAKPVNDAQARIH
jgi:sortase A